MNNDTVSEPLRFTGLEIRRMPGFEPRSFTIEGLTGGINVVHGPNAAGKTTMCRALNALLWPDVLFFSRARVSGQFTLEGSDWFVALDADQRQIQKNGAPASPPALPPAEHSDRYNLPLHHLLQQSTTNQSFAELIVRELSGGYDIPKAMDELGFDDSPSGVGNVTRGAEDAVEKVEQARQQLKDLEKEEQQLRSLYREKKRARQAELEAACLQQVIKWSQARQEYKEARDRLDEFPDVMDDVTGKEVQELERLNQEIESLEGDKQDADETVREANRTLEQLDYPYEEPATERISELEERLETVRERERAVDQLESDREEARSRCKEEADNLLADPEEDLDERKDTDYGELEDFSRRAESTNARLKSLEQLKGLLDVGEAEEESEENLKRATEVLENWLANPESEPARDNSQRYALIGAMVVVGLLSVGGGILFSAWFLAGLLAVPFIYWWGWPSVEKNGEAMRSAACREFEQLNLEEEPAEWAEDPVRSLLDRLYTRRAESRIRQLKITEWDRHQEQYVDLQDEQKEIEEQRQRLVKEYGFAPDTGERTLHILFNRLSRWQDAHAKVKSLEKSIETKESQKQTQLETMNGEFGTWNLDPAEDGAEAQARLKEIESRTETFRETQRELEQAQGTLEDVEETLPGKREQRDQLFRELDLEPSAESELEELCDLAEDYRDCRDQVNRAESVMDREASEMESMEAFEPRYQDWSQQRLEQELEDVQKRADELEDIQKKITRIETKIESAKENYQLEPAQAEKQRAFAALERKFHEDCEKMVGHVLGQYIQQINTERSMPEVFEEARRILSTITAGRWKLNVNQDDPPEFAVVDARTGKGKNLEELSSGTRVQVLIAVRLAFVQHGEDHVRLPLYMDETLANADDEKARSIIESTLQLAREGRQVFYFTAQGDEVAKWQSVASEQEQSINVVNLAEQRARDLEGTVNIPDPDEVFTDKPSVPPPDGRSHEEYAELLEISPVNPRRSPRSIHLWYLVGDVDLLESLLRKRCEYWGDLQTLLELGNRDIIPPEKRVVLDQIKQRARAAGEFCKQWQVGRNQPVDRAVLKDSGAVSDNYIDEVIELAEQVDWDPEEIVKGLRDGKVSGFFTEKKDELEQYFEGHDYIDRRDTLDDEMILASMHSTVDEDVFDLPQESVERLFARIHANLEIDET